MEKEEEKQQPEVLFPEPREQGGGVAGVPSIWSSPSADPRPAPFSSAALGEP